MRVREFLSLNKIFFFASILLVAQPALAKLDFEDHAFPELVTSARALAMGNAYINKVDDSWSAFYNPAGLGTVRKPQFHIANIHLEASSGLLDVIGNGPAYEIPQNYIDSFDPEDMRSKLAKNQGELAHSRINLFPNITVRGLTLGYMYSQRDRAIINDDRPREIHDAGETRLERIGRAVGPGIAERERARRARDVVVREIQVDRRGVARG